MLAELHGNPVDLETANNAAGKDYIFNNTMEGGGLGGESCIRAGHGGEMAEIVIENNFCIGRGAGGEIALREGSDRIAAKVITEAHNLARTPAEAEKAGYSTSETYLYSPISESSPTVGHGTNLTSFCSGPLALLCQDTSYAGARDSLARPSTGNWDIGAYQW